ncbi:Transcription regulatory protein [Komagataella phaffii CBS 7435]|uniref:Catalytic subunit of the SWI/SNF chromatin remodeling complex involved in transcriptional regulation n=2 Tax=Komagataella phaffii TaxID=460519 RepID=C4R9B5_KOMPG|nr:Catalytic subunit of the SWI/SNF chromatin remodeling complex involved in transcriptional regulation [Komagataella phaffii GS115]CAH2450423.1 Putative transcription regulatory protein [Komagataella phaffii CBS 7435]CAY72190.1 Catalytic subunit of the SWI/SNF chromatin remodeling complex involved in transcriptional regulation [Komagataella phaffii GS115]CCA40198.1 Transcription regulatory protein [Komagataella phaffii CBS 7435]
MDREQLTSEVNQAYNRWLQMNQQYGQQATSYPEYIQLTKYLTFAAKNKDNTTNQQESHIVDQSYGEGTHRFLERQQEHNLGQGQTQKEEQVEQSELSDQLDHLEKPEDLDHSMQQVLTNKSEKPVQPGSQFSMQEPSFSDVLPHVQEQEKRFSSTTSSDIHSTAYDQTQSASSVVNPLQAYLPNNQLPPETFSGQNYNTIRQDQDHQQEQKQPQVATSSMNATTIFNSQQSFLLKAQLTAFRGLAKNQQLPPEVRQVLSTAYNQLKQRVNTPVENTKSRGVKTDLEHSQDAFKEHGFNQSMQQSISQNLPQNVSQLQNYSQAPVGHPASIGKGSQTDKSVGFKGKRDSSLTASKTPKQPYLLQQKHIQTQPNISSPQFPNSQMTTQLIPQSGQEVARVANTSTPLILKMFPPDTPPVSISELTKKMPTVLNIVQVHDPTVKVDSFTVPFAPPKGSIPFESLASHRSSMLLPSVHPPVINTSAARETYDLLHSLSIDYYKDSLEKMRMESNFHNETALRGLELELDAIMLLPLQKALRGHILSITHHQNSLLINNHPNFLSKTRKVSIDDAVVTNNLYVQQQSLAVQMEQTKQIKKLDNIIESSKYLKDCRMTMKERRSKMGKLIYHFHSLVERDEQKRIEKNARQRLQALKANDEETYIKLLDQTKDARITHLLKQTNSFLDSLAQAVKDQQQESKLFLGGGSTYMDDNLDAKDNNDSSTDYYSIAHKIKEEITKQPTILVGGVLKEYQVKGLQWMVSLFNNKLNGILADEMGLGKTIQTISLLTYLVEKKNIPGPFLVIVPLSTLTNWNSEFDKWAPSLKKITYKGNPQFRKTVQADIRAKKFQVLLTTYEYIIKDRPLLSKVKWVHMIIDEGHRMKNANSKLSSTLTQYYHSDYRLILTGTPLQNSLPELWALLNFVLPKIFNSVKSFDEWFNTPFANTGSHDKIALSEEETLLVIRRLHKVLRPFLLRRLKKDVEKDLPEKIEKVVKCKSSALQIKLYEQMLKYNQLFVGDESKKPIGVKGLNNKLMQLRKICNHPFVFEEVENLINPTRETNNNIWRVSGKFELLDRILPKFKATGHRVLIFFQMTQIMDIMEDFLRLRDMKYLRLDGATKSDDRQDMLRLFNAEGSDYFAFLLSTRAGGLGLNLQTADTVIIFDSDWNPHQDLQAQDRAHRIGQKNEVRILRLITEDSIEEVILSKAYEKLDIDGKVIQAGRFDNKSTAEEQEAILRQLLEAGESKKSDSEFDDDMDDDELNQLLARDDTELRKFQQLDKDRVEETKILPRLFTEAELPEVYSQDPDLFMQKNEDIDIYGRGNRERKMMHYDDNMTEEQWLRQLEDSEDDNDGPEPGRKSKGKATDDGLTFTEGGTKRELNDLEAETNVVDVRKKHKSDNKPMKVAKIRTLKPKDAGRTKGKLKPGFNVPLSRHLFSTLPVLDNRERQQLQDNITAINNHLLQYMKDGRNLSVIFLTKPPKRLYPDYYILIKYPIAFDVIKKRISRLVYVSLEEFMNDIHLMFNNARTYNEENSVVYNDAELLEGQALLKYREITGNSTIDFSNLDSMLGISKMSQTPKDTSKVENNFTGDNQQLETAFMPRFKEDSPPRTSTAKYVSKLNDNEGISDSSILSDTATTDFESSGRVPNAQPLKE